MCRLGRRSGPGLARRAGALGVSLRVQGSQRTLRPVRLTVLACPQDAGRRESVARAAVVGAAPRLPHGRRLRVSQSPERVSITRGPWEERQGDRGDGGWGQPWLPDLISLPLARPRRDPDNVTFCVLAADEEDEGDIALQIHFTLIQAFCCENDIDIVRVGDVQRLAAIVGTGDESGAPVDLHCILISVSVAFGPL